mgnify:CR=1 FL=1
MGHVCLLVFLSMAITFGASWFWHISEMSAEVDRNKIENDAVIVRTKQIVSYRDALKDGGKETAEVYLSTSTPRIYGN